MVGFLSLMTILLVTRMISLTQAKSVFIDKTWALIEYNSCLEKKDIYLY